MTPEEELALLQTARATLLSGKARTEVSYGDRTVKYAAANLAELNARIAELTVATGGEAAARKPLGVVW